MALRRVSDAVFKRPVKLGDTLRVRGRVAEVKPTGGEAGLVAFDWTVENQDDRAVCRARVEVLWRCDTAAASEAPAANGFVPIPL
jgi:acyl dehydratase